MISVILPTVVDILRRELNLSADVVGVRSNQRPPPTAGDFYLAVYGSSYGVFDPDINVGIDFNYSIGLTLTHRTQYNPYDIVDEELYVKGVQGMETILYKCCGALHLNFDMLGDLNTRIGLLNTSAPAYIEPFRFKSMDPAPTNITEKWFRPDTSLAAAITASQDYPYCGMIMEAVFGDCRRVLNLTDLQDEVAIL